MPELDSYIYRVKDASSARKIYDAMWEGDKERQRKRSQVRRQLEGAPPFNPRTLQERGELWRTNHNFRDMEMAANRAELPFWEAVHRVPHTISPNIQSGSPETEKWNQGLAKAFDRFLKKWGKGYVSNFGQLTREYVRFGIGLPRWEDIDKARWVSEEQTDILWPKNTPTDPDRWEVMAIRHEMSPSELLKMHKKALKSKDSFWNADMTKHAIMLAKGSSGQQQHAVNESDWNDIQDEITNNDLVASVVWPNVKLVTLYVREDNGNMGEYTFLRQTPPTGAGVTKDDFLFRRTGYYEDFVGEKGMIGPVFWGSGTNKIHSVKGFAVRNFGLGVLTDKTKCRIIDGGTLSMALNFTRTIEASDDNPTLESYGPVNVFPEGLQQQSVYPNMRDGINALGILENTAAENNTQYRETQRQIQQTDTATQAEILASMEAAVSQANMSLFLSQVGDNLYAPMFFRLLRNKETDDGKDFWKWAQEAGVPERILDGIVSGDIEVIIAMTASPEMASSAARQRIWRELLQFANMPGVNGRWLLQSYVANRVSPDAVDKVLPPEAFEGNKSAERLALFENSGISEGMPIPVDELDDHVKHIEVHLPAYESAVARSVDADGIDQSLAPFLNGMTPHLAQHFAQAERDDTLSEMVDPFRERYIAARNSLRGLITRLGQNNDNGEPRSIEGAN